MANRLYTALLQTNKLTDAQLISRSQKIHDGLSTNAVTFPDVPFTLLSYQGIIDAYQLASAAAVKGSKSETAAKTVAKTNLINANRVLLTYVNEVAQASYTTTKDNETVKAIILSSGADASKLPVPAANNTGMEIPRIKKAISDQVGTLHILLRQYAKPKRGKIFFSVLYRTAASGVTPAGTWINGTFTSGNINIPSLDSGKTYEFQVAAINGRNTKLNEVNPTNYTPIQSVVII